MREDVRGLKHKIDRTQKKIRNLEERKDNLSVHGYWSLGYWEGRLSVLEDMLDEMQEAGKQEGDYRNG